MEEFDPAERVDLDQVQEEYQRKHGVGVELIKRQVGPGDAYSNQAARAVISPRGAWLECVDLPMEFSGGSGGPVQTVFPTDEELLSVLGRLNSAVSESTEANSRVFSLFFLYTTRGIYDGRGLYVYHLDTRSGSGRQRPVVEGRFVPDSLPLMFKLRVDTDLLLPDLEFRRGVIFGLSSVGERNLLVRIPYDGPDVRDLSGPPTRTVTQ